MEQKKIGKTQTATKVADTSQRAVTQKEIRLHQDRLKAARLIVDFENGNVNRSKMIFAVCSLLDDEIFYHIVKAGANSVIERTQKEIDNYEL